MEDQLFQLFCERRDNGYTVRRWWFRKMAIKLFRELYVNPLRAQGKENDGSVFSSFLLGGLMGFAEGIVWF